MNKASIEDSQKQATSPDELRRQLMDSNVPKSEREWFAVSIITDLECKLTECERESVRLALLDSEQIQKEQIQLRDAQAKIVELERKLACYGNMPAVLLETERKLAAAREAMPLFGKKLHCLYLEVEPSIANDIMESYKELFAALTEAGEGEK